MKDQKPLECTTNTPSSRDTSASQALSQNKQPSNLKRRHVVSGTLTGVAAAVWHKPIINAMVLPAHAQMSAANQFFAAAAAVTPIAKNDSLLDSIVSPAYAVAYLETESEYSVMVVQPTAGVNSYMVDVFERKLQGESNVGEIVYSGTAAIGGSANLAISDNPCELKADPLAIELFSVDATEAVINLTAAGGQIRVPAGMGTLPTPMCVDTGLPNSFFDDSIEAAGGITSTQGVLDNLIPQAHAGIEISNRTLGLAATKIDEDNYDVSMLNFNGNILRSGTLNVSGAPGSLVFQSNACSGDLGRQGGTIAASIISVTDSSMTINLDLDDFGGNYEVPAGNGSLSPSCAVTQSNFTTQNRRLKFAGKNSLLDALVPSAHAGINSPIGPLNEFIANASYSNGSFDVTIVGELAALIEIQQGGYNVEWNGIVSLGGTTTLMASDGCPIDAMVTISQRGKPNQFDITVMANGSQVSNILNPGTSALPQLTECIIEEPD